MEGATDDILKVATKFSEYGIEALEITGFTTKIYIEPKISQISGWGTSEKSRIKARRHLVIFVSADLLRKNLSEFMEGFEFGEVATRLPGVGNGARHLFPTVWKLYKISTRALTP
ncbi:hypothetical protein P4E94_09150 [Pontiellaceae bacterium B12219]|nr:hypothetical protein [Pontiellaceae bacterium B12219]